MRFPVLPPTALLLILFAVGLGHQAQAQDGDRSVLNQHDYRLHSSSEYGLAASNNRKFNYVVETSCRFTERQAKGYARALADSLSGARPALDEITVFLYLEGMDPAGMAVADATQQAGTLKEENFRAFAYDYTKWKDASVCEWEQ